ncbi:23S rRNA (adenine(2030)-N(6))-methyltransferase RlmJ [Jeongeupia chitinilytica]|uniref:Ribosomal RNA large subunit methyltransferase J n=1 Tax=Jeongeupia chitinilytica TaxID=1041641 RepID=A0ABQ3GW02_9NEIS|nr:23S rRNA (adenine(2030)-N(6))-methyltransferase RlmJ [Jeongeupia chitinilytica]GHD57066.1 ribosomal RNA large subunit methyltransferase J [Jeongeupia chitinilytica]
MLSYRHAFHAGNHADVLKHFILVELLSYLNQKDKAYWYVDTHAGAGLYQLTEGYAAKNAEFEGGIARLWQRNDLPEALARYVEVVRRFNPDGKLAFYPGSPLVAQAVMRRDDKLRLFELHPSDSKLLEANCETLGRQAQVQLGDGFNGLKSVLPPPPRRGLTLIDPPYEDKGDYRTVVKAMEEGLRRFATGTFAIWYPTLQRAESRELPEALKKLPAKGWLDVRLQVQSPSADGFGMHGSGMFIVNPPYTLADTLKPVMPLLADALALDTGAGFTLEHHSA